MEGVEVEGKWQAFQKHYEVKVYCYQESLTLFLVKDTIKLLEFYRIDLAYPIRSQ